LIDLPYPELLNAIRQAAPQGASIYLVGGAVRDLLLARPIHDLDFVLPKNGIGVARRVANLLSGSFFPLDNERDAGRVIHQVPSGPRLYLDFSSYRAPDLEADLRDRDFTINAIALDIYSPDKAIDPLGGVRDIRARTLRACTPEALLNDPARIMRGVRQAADLQFQIEPETRQLMRAAIPQLGRVAVERLRDELFKILDGPRPVTALRAMDILGLLETLLPELAPLRGVQQTAPHVDDVLSHSLNTVQRLFSVLSVLSPQHEPEEGSNWTNGLISLRIGRYRQQINEHLAASLNPDRSLTALMMLAALYHDVGKAETRTVDETGRVRFFEHEQNGARLAALRAERLHLSNDEIERLKTIVQHHMRPLLLAQGSGLPTRRAIYRFFRDTGRAGVDICLLSLADTLATYGTGIPEHVWTRQLDIIRSLLEAWWEQAETHVSPPVLLSGHDLMETLNLPPGPVIGKLLEEIREAQASGEIASREQALAYARACQPK
jgi:putative nucleotidyltransferase with HDIG domain